MTYLALMQILAPETCKQMIREQDVAEWGQEAAEGICAEPYMGNVCKDDQPLEDSGLWCDEIPEANYFADVPFPNPVSQSDED